MYNKVFEKRNDVDILLSICIPTYNRKIYLTEIINMLAKSSFPDNFELVISDNGSTDDTIQSIIPLLESFGNVVIFGSETNHGPDRNFINSVNISSGKFFWLLGSDDMPLENYKLIPDKLANNDFLMLNFAKGDKGLNLIGKHLWFNQSVADFCVDTTDTDKQAFVFDNAEPLWGFYFGYISSIVFKRSTWDTIAFDEEWYGTFFSFSYVIYRALFAGFNFKYERDFICIMNRGYNDSMGAEFSGDKYFKRLEIDFVAFFNIYNNIQVAKVKKAYQGLMARNYKYMPLIQYRYRLNPEQWRYIEDTYFKYFLDKFTLVMFDNIMPVFKKLYFIMYKIKKGA